MEVNRRIRTSKEKTANPIPKKRKTTQEKRKRESDFLPAKRLILFIIVLAALPVRPAAAWFQGSLGVEETWTDNLFLISESESDWITSPFLSIQFGPFAGWSPFFSLAGNLYAFNPDLNGLIQEGGIDYSRSIGAQTDAANQFAFGLRYAGSIHVEESRDLDYHEIGSYMGFALRPQPAFLIRPEIEGAYRTFPEEGDLSFIETGLSLLMNKSFQTATTLRLTGRVDYKQFLQEVETESTTGDSQQAAQTTRDTTDLLKTPVALPPLYAGQNGGNGMGQDSGDDTSSGSGRQGSGDSGSGSGDGMGGRGSSQAGAFGSVLNSETVQAAQVYASLRIAQSFAQKVGAYLQVSYRYNLLDPPRYVEGRLPALDREIYDDHYGYQGPGASSQLGVVILPGFSWKVRGEYEMRQYEDRDALDQEGIPLQPSEERLDHRVDAITELAYSHPFDLPFPSYIQLGLAYGHVWNLSNDAFYDAQENWCLLSAAIGW